MMKHLRYFAFLLSFLIAGFSCTDDEINPTPTPGDKTANEWIYEKMVDQYLWYDEIPSKSSLNFSSDTQEFFYSLLSDNDGKTNYYSYISPKTGTKAYMGEEVGFGFEYQAYKFPNLNNKIALQIIYVLKDSPAYKEGLKRGDWITKINGSSLTSNNYYSALHSSTTSSVTLRVADSPISDEIQVHLKAEVLQDSPVYKTATFNSGGRKITYLMYNHFTMGTEDDANAFDNELRETMNKFGSTQDMILDLRYNGGGYVSCARLLASFLVPTQNINDIFCRMTFNDKHAAKRDYNYTFKADEIGNNLNIDRLFIVTSQRSASASELVIAGLQPFLKSKLYIIGTSADYKTSTEGKNVGSEEIKDDNYDWILHPIVCNVTNKENLIYADGFEPTAGFALEESNGYILGELGTEEDKILKSILDFISTGKMPANSKSTKASSTEAILLGSSLDHKTTKGLKL